MIETDILVVGAGAAGLSAASAAVKAGARVLLIDSAPRAGGILPQCLHKGFGHALYGEELDGPAFLSRLLSSLPEETELLLNTAAVRILPDRSALLSSPEGLCRVRFSRLLLAAGSREKSIRSLGVGGTSPCGVYPAGLAQELVNLDAVSLGKRVVILGSGDVGLVMAGRLCEIGIKPIAIIEKNPVLGGLVRNQKRYIYANDIPVRNNTTVVTLHGERVLEGVTTERLDTGERDYIPCDTLITALGLVPERTLFDTAEFRGVLPDWVTPVGNCDFTHDIVDRVVRDGERIGAQIARELIEK